MAEVVVNTDDTVVDANASVVKKFKNKKKAKKKDLTPAEITRRGTNIISDLDNNTRYGEAAVTAANEMRESMRQLRRFENRILKPESFKIDHGNAIDRAIVRNTELLAEVLQIHNQVLYDMIEAGIVTRFLSTEQDWHVLTTVLPFLARSEEALRYSLQHFTPRQRNRILDTLECKTKTERKIKQALLKDSTIPFWSVWTNENGKSKLLRVGIDMHLKYWSEVRFGKPVKGLTMEDGLISLPVEMEITAQSQENSKQRQALREAEAMYLRIKDNIRKQAAYAASDSRGLTGVALEWHLYHLEVARQSSTNEVVKATVNDLQIRKRLRCVKAINKKIIELGGDPPPTYKDYIKVLREELTNYPDENARLYMSRIAAIERDGVKSEHMGGWVKELEAMKDWVAQWTTSDEDDNLPF